MSQGTGIHSPVTTKETTMDIYCPKCGEPWDIDSLHDEVAARSFDDDLVGEHVDRSRPVTFAEVRRDFSVRGCEALGTSHGEGVAHPAIGEILDLLGDDIDGAASLLDDFQGLFA
jgi:hypothetical protein